MCKLSAAYLCELETETHFPSTLSHPQYGSLDKTQSKQVEDLSQLAGDIWTTLMSEPT